MNITERTDLFLCRDCGETGNGWTVDEMDTFYTKHAECHQTAPRDRDRLAEHDERIGESQSVWTVRLILAITSAWLMVGMHLNGAYIWQSALAGCVVFVAGVFFFEHDPAKDADQ